MDRTRVCGTRNPGSTPGGSTDQRFINKLYTYVSFYIDFNNNTLKWTNGRNVRIKI